MSDSHKKPLRWRVVLFIQRCITRIAPPLHSIHWKVFVLFMLVLLVPLTVAAWRVRKSIETSYLHSTEEGMIDTAAVVAELYVRLYKEFGADSQRLSDELARAYRHLDQTFQIKARLFGYTRNEVDTRLFVFDREGRVIFDTDELVPPGTDFSQKTDVRHALRGQYGSRWEHDVAQKRVNLYSTLPVFVDRRIVGVVSVSKPTNRIRNFIVRSLKQLAIPGAVTLLIASLLAYALAGYLSRIVRDLARRAERIADGESGVTLETWTKSELGDLARAVERMRRKLEGKAYVEEMASNLSHELKTPLAAIRGAAEVLEDGAMNDPAARAKFLANIQSEARRLDRIVNELLKLSRIETQADETDEPVDAAEVARELAALYAQRVETLGIEFRAGIASEPFPVRVPEAQLAQIFTSLLDNALQFTPAGKSVTLVVAPGEIRVHDSGPGIEPDLMPKIFTRFFTTENPRTGQRGTGLGLAIVKAIVERHRGSVSVESAAGQGCVFTVRLPG